MTAAFKSNIFGDELKFYIPLVPSPCFIFERRLTLLPLRGAVSRRA
jgi:hypothetical protein